MSPLVRAVLDAIQEADDSGFYYIRDEEIAFDVSVDPAEFDRALRKQLARPVPPQTIDRDALLRLIVQDSEHESWTAEKFADRILALVRPVEGVTGVGEFDKP